MFVINCRRRRRLGSMFSAYGLLLLSVLMARPGGRPPTRSAKPRRSAEFRRLPRSMPPSLIL